MGRWNDGSIEGVVARTAALASTLAPAEGVGSRTTALASTLAATEGVVAATKRVLSALPANRVSKRINSGLGLRTTWLHLG